MVERLADLPGPAELLGDALQVPARHVEAGGIAEDVAERVLFPNVPSAGSYGGDQLHLVVQIRRAGRVGHVTAARDDGGRRLHEEKRRLAVRVVAHLAGMLGVVAPDAEYPAHGKHRLRSPDRQDRPGRGRNRICHDAASFACGAPHLACRRRAVKEACARFSLPSVSPHGNIGRRPTGRTGSGEGE